MARPDLDVRARGREPAEGEATWLVVCKTCGWHTETPFSYCWKGCPNCAADLWVAMPAGRAFQLLSGETKREMRPRNGMPTSDRGGGGTRGGQRSRSAEEVT